MPTTHQRGRRQARVQQFSPHGSAQASPAARWRARHVARKYSGVSLLFAPQRGAPVRCRVAGSGKGAPQTRSYRSDASPTFQAMQQTRQEEVFRHRSA